MTVAAVVLAAGGGTRFIADHHKLLADVRGRPVVAWALEHALEAGLDETVVVTGAVEVPAEPGVTMLHNPDWQQGQATSLQVALRHADARGPRRGRGRAGRPARRPADDLAGCRRPCEAPIAVPTYDGRRGNPVRLARTRCGRCCRTSGDEGARALMREQARSRRPRYRARQPRRHRHRGGSRAMELTNEFRVERAGRRGAGRCSPTSSASPRACPAPSSRRSRATSTAASSRSRSARSPPSTRARPPSSRRTTPPTRPCSRPRAATPGARATPAPPSPPRSSRTATAPKVTVATDLTVTGKVAQFGRGVLADVSAKLLDQFVEQPRDDGPRG